MKHPKKLSPPLFHSTLLLLILFSTLLIACTTESQEPAEQATLPLEDCVLASTDGDVQLDAQCGTLSVFENPTTQSGRQIELSIAVIPAINRNPAPDPLFFLTGGPGQAATESFLSLGVAFRDINRERDIVLVDQRGTGQSHQLRCNETEEFTEENVEIQPFLEACLSELDADPAFYTTSIAMQDLDKVREALGYTQINLYGISYGTRAALTYLRMFPEQVRTVILDGVAPQQLALGLDIAADAQRALDLIFTRCKNDPVCAENFPDLPAQFEAILAQLDAAPVPVQVVHPITGERIEMDFTREMFAMTIRFYSYNPETVSLIPLLIDTAQEDYSRLASQYLILSSDLTQTISNGMAFSVQCAEDAPFYTLEEAEQAAENTYLGDSISGGLLEICETWPVGVIPSDFKDPVESDVPVLLLSGEYDPVTPPEYGELAAQTLPNSLHLVAPGQGHNVLVRGCVPDIAEAFIATASVTGLETDCVSELKPFPFFVNFSGPEP